MLSHDQAVALFQFYIKRIIRAPGRAVSSAVSVHSAVRIFRILCVDLGHFSFPGPVINPGVDQYISVHIQFAYILFIDRALDPVIADFHHSNEVVLLIAVIGIASIVDLLDNTADPAFYFRIINITFQLFDLCLFDLNIELLVFERQILLLDLNRIVGLFR